MDFALIVSQGITIVLNLAVLLTLWAISWDRPVLRSIRRARPYVLGLFVLATLVPFIRLFTAPSGVDAEIKRTLREIASNTQFPRMINSEVRHDSVRQISNDTIGNFYTLLSIPSNSPRAAETKATILSQLDSGKCTNAHTIAVLKKGISVELHYQASDNQEILVWRVRPSDCPDLT